MAAIAVDVFVDDNDGEQDPASRAAEDHAEIYITIDGKRHLLMIGHDAEGQREVYWMGEEGGFGKYEGNPVTAE